jgi:hypothetical protein
VKRNKLRSSNNENFEVHLSKKDSTAVLCQTGLRNLPDERPLSHNMNLKRENLKGAILRTAEESAGKRQKKFKRCLKTCNSDIEGKLTKKKETR